MESSCTYSEQECTFPAISALKNDASLKYPGQLKSGIIPYAAPSLSVFVQMCQLLYSCMANTANCLVSRNLHFDSL